MMTGTPSVNNLPYWYQFITLLLLLSFAWYDVKHHKVRNAALLAFLPWCLAVVYFHHRTSPWLPISLLLLYHLLGFLSGSMLLFFISLITNGSIGGGDIKLVALLGILYGSLGTCSILLIASLLAIMYLELLSILRKPHTNHFPFVPFLSGGCIITSFLTNFGTF